MASSSSPVEKRAIHEVSDSDFEEFYSKKARTECSGCSAPVDEKTSVCAQCAAKPECPVCFERVDQADMVDCQAAKKSSAAASHSVCVKCFAKMAKCPLCRTSYEPQPLQEEDKAPDYVPPSPILYEDEDKLGYETQLLYLEFKRKVESVGHSARLCEIYPRVRERYLSIDPNPRFWPGLLSSSSRYNWAFFQWVIDYEVRVKGNPSMLHRVVDSHLTHEALQLVLNGQYKGLLQLEATRRYKSMIEQVFETWCDRSPGLLVPLILWYRAADLGRLSLTSTQLVRSGLHTVPWPTMAATIRDLGLSLGRVNVTSVLNSSVDLPPLDTVKALGELDPQATWNCLQERIQGNVQNKSGLSAEWLQMLRVIRPRHESISLWSSGQYDAESFQRNARIRQVMPEAVNTTMVNLADGKVGYGPLGSAWMARDWEPVLPHGRVKSNDFLFLSDGKQEAKVTEAKLPGVAPSERFVVVYYPNEHPRQYRVYVSLKSQGNMGLDKYIENVCVPLPGTDKAKPFDGLLVPNAQFIVALKNKPRH
jgi:hypothetical protein